MAKNKTKKTTTKNSGTKESKKKTSKKLEVMNGDPSTLVAEDENVTVEEVIEEITNPENIDVLQESLEQEYGINNTEEEAPAEEETPIEDPEKVFEDTIEDIKETSEQVETLINMDDLAKMESQEEVDKFLNDKLDEIEKKEQELENKVSEAQKKLEQAQKNLKSRRFTNFWGGVKFT